MKEMGESFVLIKKIKNLSFYKKMTLIFTIVCIISTSVTGILYYKYAEQEIIGNFKINAESMVSQLENTLDIRLEAINRRAFAVLTNSSFIKPLGNFLTNPNIENEVISSGEIANWLKDIGLGEPWIHSVFLYTEKGSWDDYTKSRNWNMTFEKSIFQKIYKENPQEAIQWIPTMENEIFIGKEKVIPYVRRFTIEEFTKDEIYLIIQLDQEKLLKEMTGATKKLGHILITDKEGKYIASTINVSEESLQSLLKFSEKHEEKRYSRDFQYNGEEYLVSKGMVGLNNWQIYILKSKSDLLDNLGTLQKLIISFTILIIFFSIFLVSFLVKQMTSSLHQLTIQMERMRLGERNARYYYPYHDEVGILARTFNYMADEIESSIKKQEEYIIELKEERDLVKQVEEQKRKAVLTALQAQIDPHFLYNTLNTITWLAADKGVDEVRILSHSLGRFYRISLSKGAEIISLRDEIEHVKSYLKIQEIKYAKIMKYHINVPEELMNYTILKLVLQPLVENSIHHGTKGKEEVVTINIIGELKQINENTSWIQFVVEDNGVGIPPDKLETINKGLEDDIKDHRYGYGIFNVNERIKLYYGSNYGIYYESEEEKWTKAFLTIPVITH